MWLGRITPCVKLPRNSRFGHAALHYSANHQLSTFRGQRSILVRSFRHGEWGVPLLVTYDHVSTTESYEPVGLVSAHLPKPVP
jgi:hypothetical protein